LEEESCTEEQCEWINLSEWSPCKGGKQFKTRECSCKDEEENIYRYGDYDQELFTYSSRCDGFTSTVQSCQSEKKKILTVKDWKTASWPESDDTKSRTFSCCADNWYQIMNKPTHDNRESLYAELIAARLNLMSGVSSDKVSHDLDLTENLLKECSWTPTQTKESEDLLLKLRDFNEEDDKKERKQKVDTTKDDTHDAHYLDNGKEVTASNNNEQTANSDNSHSLVILIVVPTVISIVVSGLAVALIFFKNKQQQQQTQVIKA
jgi:hypothetical protein